MHGYQMIQEIGRRSGGSWRPSPGSVYPTLQQLEDEGLVRAEEQDGRRVYRLTEDGRHHVADRADEFADMWADMAPERDENAEEMGGLVFGVAAAFLHVMRTGSSRQVDQARSVLARTRTDLYRILGDEEPAGDDDDPADNSDGDEDPDLAGAATDDEDGPRGDTVDLDEAGDPNRGPDHDGGPDDAGDRP
jgi:DNA-binding PadR family transcriptional regulator